MDYQVDEFLRDLQKADHGTTSYIVGLIEEESFTFEEKVDAIISALEVEVTDDLSANVAALIKRCESLIKPSLQTENDTLPAEVGLAPTATALKDDTRSKVLAQYGSIEDSSGEEELDASEAAALKKSLAMAELEKESKFNKKDKKRDKATRAQMDLLSLPNLNSAKVEAERERKRREDAEKQAAKKQKDKADRKKQLDDEKKKLEERRKKAQKVERRG